MNGKGVGSKASDSESDESFNRFKLSTGYNDKLGLVEKNSKAWKDVSPSGSNDCNSMVFSIESSSEDSYNAPESKLSSIEERNKTNRKVRFSETVSIRNHYKDEEVSIEDYEYSNSSSNFESIVKNLSRSLERGDRRFS